ncbi:hypothetical protein LCGC14_2603620, partial [marine sediment metagenome]
NGIAYQRPPLVPRTSVIGSFLWPTPTEHVKHNRQTKSAQGGTPLSLAVRVWPTPQAHDTQKGDANRVGRFGTSHGGRDLTDWVQMWPTPMPSDVEGGRTTKGKSRQNETGLRKAVQRWPTPTATERENDTTATPSEKSLRRYQDGEIKRVRKTRSPTLTTAVKMLPTPTARDYRSPGTPERLARAKQESSRGQPLTETVGGQLNPTWVEWLMGFPLGWTALEPSETL